jgi:hypothetical protein
MTVVAGLIAARFGSVTGGLFLAFPAIFPASATLIEKHVRERKEKAGLPGARRGKEAAALDAPGGLCGPYPRGPDWMPIPPKTGSLFSMPIHNICRHAEEEAFVGAQVDLLSV